jgi:hypothetical protein
LSNQYIPEIVPKVREEVEDSQGGEEGVVKRRRKPKVCKGERCSSIK